ncbi:MAG: CoA-disulfide reductase, partial [Turicibacter sp.]
MKKIIIVGGVAGGATAAARLRRLSEEDQIIMFEKDEYVSYANCGLPYYIGEVITDREKLLVQTVPGLSKRFNLDVRNFCEVMSINPEAKTVHVKNHQTHEEYDETYDKLILSPGAKPIMLPIKGIERATNVFTLRNVPDTDKIYNYMFDHQVKKAVVIGAGFIGLEVAENLVHRGVEVTLVNNTNQVMAPIDYEMAAFLHLELKRKGVNLILNDSVVEIKDNGAVAVLGEKGDVQTDMIIMAVGVVPDTKLAKQAGLTLGVTKAIEINDHLQTSNPDIYAIGDAVEVKHYITKHPVKIPLAWPANRQGRLVADHINGMDVKYNGSLGTSVAKIFDLDVALTGYNERALKMNDIAFESIIVHPNNHAGYYPGASQLHLKVLFEKGSGRLYGAQAVGKSGVEKRIDVIATAIKGSLTVYDLPDLELSYAPPFSSAKDPVNMAGYVGTHVAAGDYEVLHYNEVDEFVKEGGYLLDVRTPREFNLGHIKGAKNIPIDDLRDRLSDVPTDQDILVYCQVGFRGYLGLEILKQNSFKN